MNVRDELSVADPLTLDEPREPNKKGPARGLMPTPVRASAARRRKLHVGHFAFMRAVVQGIDTRASWDRYLKLEGEGTDQRLVRSTIAWIRDEFAAAAQREVSVSLQAVTFGLSFCHRQFRGAFGSRALCREHPLAMSLGRRWSVPRFRPLQLAQPCI